MSPWVLLSLPAAVGVTSARHQAWLFMCVLGLQLRSSRLRDKHSLGSPQLHAHSFGLLLSFPPLRFSILKSGDLSYRSNNENNEYMNI